MNISRKLRIAVPVYSMEGYVNYFNAFEHMGVQGVLADSPAAFAECDGLLLPGGWDVEPTRYGQANTASEGVDLALDALQFGALERFIQSGRPVLGICRGHQLLNVAFGGSLIQHLPGHTKAKGETLDLIHPIRSVPGSWIDALYGAEAVVNSSHHQVSR